MIVQAGKSMCRCLLCCPKVAEHDVGRRPGALRGTCLLSTHEEPSHQLIPQMIGLSLRTVVFGSESLAIESIRALRSVGYDVLALVTDSSILANRAGEERIMVLPDLDALRSAGLQFDLLFSITNLTVVPADITSLARVAAINFHDGPLPLYSGLNAPVRALLDGATRYGVTWHLMTDAVDAGGILAQRMFDIAPDETALTLNARCYEAAIESFTELAEALTLGLPPTTQSPLDAATHCPRGWRPDAGSAIDFSLDAASIARLARALDHGTYANPVAVPTGRVQGTILLIPTVELLATRSGAPPGTVLALDDLGVTVATGSVDVLLPRLHQLDGRSVGIAELSAIVTAGSRFEPLESTEQARLAEVHLDIGRHEDYWTRRLGRLEQPELPGDQGPGGQEPQSRSRTLAIPETTPETLGAAAIAWLSGVTGQDAFDLGFADAHLAGRIRSVGAWFAQMVPLRVEVRRGDSFGTLSQNVGTELGRIRRRGTWSLDAPARRAGLKYAAPPRFAAALRFDADKAADGAALTLAFPHAGATTWWYDSTRLDAASVARMQAEFATLLEKAVAQPDASIASLLSTSDAPWRSLLDQWNATSTPIPDVACIHELVSLQAMRTPNATAVVAGNESLTYRELDRRSNQLARHLRRLGVAPDMPVGLAVERSTGLLVGMLGILKAGGAYVPLDPSYPSARLTMMLEDSAARVVVTEEAVRHRLPEGNALQVRLDSDWPLITRETDAPPDTGVAPNNLAYVIYTSGSTGRPKGVMVEHRNVVNFFTAMDSRIGAGPGTWLAVTSLSFDISVLELLWTLTRGFTVILHRDDTRGGMGQVTSRVSRDIDFSLFYFSSDESGSARSKYRLLLDGARFADQHGFAAVWTPERHFHAFGGLYPNPSVTGAAIATITERVQIRAGSCVLPLHHPARVAEEWSVVDNLSNGRVGLSFAAGWQPNDFLLRPGSWGRAKETMFEEIDVVRRLWRGEQVEFPGATGTPVAVHTLPRPVQPELPFWVTTAGNPATFQQAGRVGANLLTHLLGQTIEELRDKIRLYREARKAAGHEGPGVVSLMLHTFVGPDDAAVREAVRAPLIAYLRSSVNLIQQYAWSFPAFKRPGQATAEVDIAGLEPAELDALLEHAFERYYQTSGLFGTPDACVAIVDRLKEIDVDDVACLIDFGVDDEAVLRHLPHLDELRQRTSRAQEASDSSVPALIARHGVTHLQCTPSMASMVLQLDGARDALGQLERLMIGGEALPESLASELRVLVGARGEVHNMYGPTETTIWSTTHRVDGSGGAVPLGTPIANTKCHVVDAHLSLVPPGVAGELLIGGAGVARGYLGRPELTAERFIPDPFDDPGGRLYRTGDLARWRADGVLEFLGRLDHQVKIRGFRIELGEIESRLRAATGVREAVVVAREDVPGDKRLVAYVTAGAGTVLSPAALRGALREELPEHMIPSHIVVLTALPLTPNAKVDRKALPAPEQVTAASEVPFVPPSSEVEETIASVWREVLNIPRVGTAENFFDLGGHSLLAIQAHRRLKEALQRPVTVTDIFRFPTIRALADHLGNDRSASTLAAATAARAQSRKAAASRRLQARRPGES